MTLERRLLLRDIDVPDIERIETYLECGGYRAARRVWRQADPKDVIEEVASAGLRDRGGAWYLLADRWRTFTPEGYLCVDACESEPGSFRDHKLMERNPHQIVEGILIAAYAMQCRTAYLCIRGEEERGERAVARAVEEAYQRGFLGDDVFGTGQSLDLYLHPEGRGGIPGEPSSLLRLVEGERAVPVLEAGKETLFGRPALVENAGTLAYLPHIVERGSGWFRELGSERCPGTLVFCVSGHVRRPGLYELEVGAASLREIVEECAGGVREGHRIKAVFVGCGDAVLPPGRLDVRTNPESFGIPDEGSFSGRFDIGEIVVLDDATCMVDAALQTMRRYERASCGVCAPCRTGTGWLRALLGLIEEGRGKKEDIDLMEDLAARLSSTWGSDRLTLCSLGARAAGALSEFLRTFRAEFELHVERKGCPVEKDLRIKIPDTVSVRF